MKKERAICSESTFCSVLARGQRQWNGVERARLEHRNLFACESAVPAFEEGRKLLQEGSRRAVWVQKLAFAYNFSIPRLILRSIFAAARTSQPPQVENNIVHVGRYNNGGPRLISTVLMPVFIQTRCTTPLP